MCGLQDTASRTPGPETGVNDNWKDCPFGKDIARLDGGMTRLEVKIDGLNEKVDGLRISQAQAVAGASTSKMWWDTLKFFVTVAVSVLAAMGVLAARGQSIVK